MLKNKFVLLLLIGFLFVLNLVPVKAYEADDSSVNSVETLESINDIELNQNEQEMNLPELPSRYSQRNTYKQPLSKKKIAKKFILAMLCVGFSAFAIYIGLVFYKKFKYGINKESTEHSGENSSLETPDNILQALNTFLEKTNWGNR